MRHSSLLPLHATAPSDAPRRRTTGHLSRWMAAAALVALGGCALMSDPVADPTVTALHGGGAPKPSPVQRAAMWVQTAAGYGPDEGIAREHFQRGETLYREASAAEGDERRRKFTEAAEQFQKAAGRWPDSPLEEEALLLAGESYFFADEYPKAEEAFGELVRRHPNTRHMDTVDRRRFAIGQYWIEHAEKDPSWPITPNLTSRELPMFDKFNHGLRVLNRIRLDDPTGRLADDATMAAARAHFQAGNYMRADELLTDLRHAFPDSEHQFVAHLMSLHCKMLIYQGAQYDSAPLEEAETLLKQIHRQFPAEAAEHKDFLLQVAKDVRMNKAMREWQRARYFDRRKQYGAARKYYQVVRDEYSDTSLAVEAERRIGELAGLSNSPPQYLPWLVEMLPEHKPAKPLIATNPFSDRR